MERADFFPDWRELVTFATPHRAPTLLRDESDFRVLAAGLEAGGKIPAHPEHFAVDHILEERARGLSTPAGSCSPPGRPSSPPCGSRRGIEVRTRLAFLAVRVGPHFESGD